MVSNGVGGGDGGGGEKKGDSDDDYDHQLLTLSTKCQMRLSKVKSSPRMDSAPAAILA